MQSFLEERGWWEEAELRPPPHPGQPWWFVGARPAGLPEAVLYRCAAGVEALEFPGRPWLRAPRKLEAAPVAE